MGSAIQPAEVTAHKQSRRLSPLVATNRTDDADAAKYFGWTENAEQMSASTLQPNISYAIERGWVRWPQPKFRRVAMPMSERRRRNTEGVRRKRHNYYAKGLTNLGTVRTRNKRIPDDIITAAENDGVGVTAIYNRLKRTGRLTLRKIKT